MQEGLSKDTKLKLFADDSLLYRKIKSRQDSIQLQKDLDKLCEWEKKWSMEFNPKKCQIISFRHSKDIKFKFYYTIHNTTLDRTRQPNT